MLRSICFAAVLAFVASMPIANMNSTNGPLPVVIWHGMGDSCCNPLSMGSVKKMIEDAIPGIYVKSLMIGATVAEDTSNGFFMPINEQIDNACAQIAADEKLQGGFNALGFSQGSQFLRAYVQRCNKPAVHNLLSVGGQHQGVFGMPRCLGENHTLCEEMRKLLDLGAYIPLVQKRLVQAEYWHDPLNVAKYRKDSLFLADVNNENVRNEAYIANLQSLNKFVMVMFTKDSMVQPRESELFGFYKEGSDKVVLKMEETPLYLNDQLGLKAMNEKGQLVFLECEGDHLRMPKGWFQENLMQYLQ